MNRLLLSLCMPAVLAMRVQVSEAATEVKGLPEWFERVRVSARPGIFPWFVEFGATSEDLLRSRAAEATRQVHAERPEKRKEAVRLLGDIGAAIPLPEAKAVLQTVARTDPTGNLCELANCAPAW